MKQVLVELGEDLRLSAEREVEELQLPMRDADIQRLCKQSKRGLFKGRLTALLLGYLYVYRSSICYRIVVLRKHIVQHYMFFNFTDFRHTY